MKGTLVSINRYKFCFAGSFYLKLHIDETSDFCFQFYSRSPRLLVDQPSKPSLKG